MDNLHLQLTTQGGRAPRSTELRSRGSSPKRQVLRGLQMRTGSHFIGPLVPVRQQLLNVLRRIWYHFTDSSADFLGLYALGLQRLSQLEELCHGPPLVHLLPVVLVDPHQDAVPLAPDLRPNLLRPTWVGSPAMPTSNKPAFRV